ncbi:hypothetical protein ECC02_000135 [Trypanosoma cruzi]|uniref:Uncharacterized protein n=1 Tax=Trypanosoma cruzi TaxID=5693 RepID=A0A7J6YIQ1_TRYCR|nr:hypothetical protein ECC02_000135 [Trypanosoma cruzi]
MDNAQFLPSHLNALLSTPRLPTGLQAPEVRDKLLSKVLAFCLLGRLRDVDGSIRDAENLLRKYEGMEGELISILHEKYGQPSEELVEKAKKLSDTYRNTLLGATHEVLSPSTEVANMGLHALANSGHSILARMQRERELEDVTWRRVHAAAKGMLVSLEEVQRRVAMQEVEVARLTSEHSRRLRELEEEDRNQEELKTRLASTVTQLQLTLMRLRGGRHGGDDTVEAIRDIEYKRHILNTQRREEEDLIQLYRRVLRQHLTSYPLSSLREEIGRVDAELRKFMQESPL